MKLALSLVIAGLAALAPRPVSACSCTNPPTIPDELQWSREIYTAFLVSIEPSPDGNPAEVLVTLRAHWVWRGTPENGLFRLITPADGALCGIAFRPDIEYLVFARPYTPPWSWAHSCGRTHEIYDDDPDVAALGPPLVTPVRSGTWGGIKVLYR